MVQTQVVVTFSTSIIYPIKFYMLTFSVTRVGGVVSESNFKFFVQFNCWTAVFYCFIAAILGVFIGEVRNKASCTGPYAHPKCLRPSIHTIPKSCASPCPLPCSSNVSTILERSGDWRQSLFQRHLTQGSIPLSVYAHEANTPCYQAESISIHWIVTIAM